MSEENTQEVVTSVEETTSSQNTPVQTTEQSKPRPSGPRQMASRGARSVRPVRRNPDGTQAATARPPFKRGPRKEGESHSPRGPRKSGDRSRKPTFEDKRPEFEQKILSIRRVVRVVSGGRRLSFAVSMIIGDKKGAIGVGTGKSIDTSLAIGKALRNAKKNLVKLRLTKNMSLPYDVEAKYATSRITMMPNRGRGIVAGSAARDIFKLGGLKDVTAKFHSGSKNKLNNARCTILALSEFAIKKMPGIDFDKEPKGVEVAETNVQS